MSTGDIAELLGISRSTVCRVLRNLKKPAANEVPKSIVALMDATYWNDHFGVVVAKDNLTGRVLWHKFIYRKERVADYIEGVRWLEEERHVEVLCVVSDGLRGLRERLSPRLFQHCQFHQILTVRERITSRPKLEAAKEFYDLVNFMPRTDRASFEGLLGEWEAKWKKVARKRGFGADGKRHYVNKNLRSAWLGVKRNMPYLWTFEEHYGLGIPNTNNAIEALFKDVKRKLGLHCGLSRERLEAMVSSFLNSHSPSRTRAGGQIRSPFDTTAENQPG